ncbi:metallophosphoesterase family protein [Paenibacillus guangzhouensis]|uniref:metallophosphoesterase family protein n=1 Tax=Paenibacillus guangzhouensis TaxID=1473112 RepID=UPI001266FF02|nr:metallophosphoesterase family protein [Paenibacillus guangzhouensis]
MTTLQFREDRTFKIVQFTDIHIQRRDAKDEQTCALIGQIVDAEQPDLVVFTGDVIEAHHCGDHQLESFQMAVQVVEERQVPWTVVFGNHDTEVNITREQLMAHAMKNPNCLAVPGPASIAGVGNYCLEVLNAQGTPAALLYHLDSGSVSTVAHVDGYGWIDRSQIAWYEQESRAYTAKNGGTPLPALAFFHIPLQEYVTAWEQGDTVGDRFEQVCCPRINTGLFAAMVEMGDVMGTFVGHDHTNDYISTLHRIQLCYGRKTGYNSYSREGFLKGARVIQLEEGSREFKTWMRLEDGSVIVQEATTEVQKTLG